MYTLVKENEGRFKHDKKELFWDENILLVDENGNRYSSSLFHKMYDLYRIFNMDSKLYWENNEQCPYKSYEDYIYKRFDEHILDNEDPEMIRIKKALIRRILKQETVEFSCTSMKDCTIKDYGSYLKYPGPDYEFPGGYSNLINFLAEQIPDTRLKCNHPVKSIELLDSSHSLHTNECIKLKVTCKNGQIFICKHVIVTCSLNYLKMNHKELFPNNLLPQNKLNLLKKLNMGIVDKIFLVYDDMSFFPENTNSLHTIFFDDEKYDIKSQWYLKIFTFDKFFDNILLVWLTGDEAEYVETLSDKEISEELTNLLKRMLKNDKVPLPSNLIRTNWYSNEYVLGSYSYIGVDGNANQDITSLAEPVYINNQPKILFAGEATHERFYTTVHGAYLSGQREAARLLDVFNLKPKLPNSKL